MTTRITDRLSANLPVHNGEPPTGWLTTKQFVERMGLSNQTQVYKAIESGKISHKHMAINRRYNEQDRIIIDWDNAAYDFIMGRRAAYRPADFKQNNAKLYKPFAVSPQQEKEVDTEEERREQIKKDVENGTTSGDSTQDIVDERIVLDKMVLQPVIDQTSARYRKEQLEIEKRQIELKKEANELISMADERSLLAGIAAELNGNASKAVPKWSPIFAAEEDPIVVRQLMKKMFVEILTPIASKAGEDDNGIDV